MTVKKLPMIFWGAKGQAKMLSECMQETEYELVGLFDRDTNLESPFASIPIFHDRDKFFVWLKETFGKQIVSYLVAVGNNGEERLQIQELLKKEGLKPLIAKHRTAHIAENVTIGEGSQIMPMACINAGASIGRATIINSGAIIEHETRVGDGIHIAPGVRLAGEIVVEDFATIYTGAIVGPRIKIGMGAVVGAGAVVLHEVPPYSLVVGCPAKVVKVLKNEQDRPSTTKKKESALKSHEF